LDGSGACSTSGTQTSLGRALSGAPLSRSLRPHRPRPEGRHGRIHRGMPKSGSTR
jgi:hypothetical protein